MQQFAYSTTLFNPCSTDLQSWRLTTRGRKLLCSHTSSFWWGPWWVCHSAKHQTTLTSTLAFWIKVLYSVTFIWLIWLPIHYLTQDPCFSIPFHLYIHDHHSNQARCRLSMVANMYAHFHSMASLLAESTSNQTCSTSCSCCHLCRQYREEMELQPQVVLALLPWDGVVQWAFIYVCQIICSCVESTSDCLMMMHHSMHKFPPAHSNAPTGGTMVKKLLLRSSAIIIPEHVSCNSFLDDDGLFIPAFCSSDIISKNLCISPNSTGGNGEWSHMSS